MINPQIGMICGDALLISVGGLYQERHELFSGAFCLRSRIFFIMYMIQGSLSRTGYSIANGSVSIRISSSSISNLFS